MGGRVRRSLWDCWEALGVLDKSMFVRFLNTRAEDDVGEGEQQEHKAPKECNCKEKTQQMSEFR